MNAALLKQIEGWSHSSHLSGHHLMQVYRRQRSEEICHE